MVEKLKIFLRNKIVLRIEKLHSIHFMCGIDEIKVRRATRNVSGQGRFREIKAL